MENKQKTGGKIKIKVNKGGYMYMYTVCTQCTSICTCIYMYMYNVHNVQVYTCTCTCTYSTFITHHYTHTHIHTSGNSHPDVWLVRTLQIASLTCCRECSCCTTSWYSWCRVWLDTERDVYSWMCVMYMYMCAYAHTQNNLCVGSIQN